ncbi:MAG: hypothetical protein QOJ57_2414 [Thermoleophilaceae bacterium]|nr:hypothetical protein [Thermoleophilaceae bacterium]
MKCAAVAAAVSALAVASAAQAGAATPARGPGPQLVSHRALSTAPLLRPRHELVAKREGLARQHRWTRAFRSARKYARARLGRVSFAVVDDEGRVRAFRGTRTFYSASLVKAMLLVTYLRRPEIRHRPLSSATRALVGPMITRSDNKAATRVRNIVGNAALARLARRAGMRWFTTSGSWGDTHLAAEDQAVFFYGIDRFVPPRHRAYARALLGHVIAPQRWGIPEVAPHRLHVYFKGGWRPSTGGWIVNQAALVEGPHGRRMSLSVLTDHNRTEGYGHETIRGVAARLVRVLAVR